MTTLMSFLCFLLLFAFISFLFLNKIKHSKQKLPPSPPNLPIIGNLHQLKGLFHKSLHDLSKKHGPVMLLNLGFIPIVVISSGESAEEVLKTHDLDCCTRPITVASSKFSRNGTDIVLAPYGESWRELRKLAVLGFLSPKKVRSFRYIREEENEFMIKKLKESALKQSPVNLNKTLFRLAASVIFRGAFGESIYESKHIDEDKLDEFMFGVQRVVSLSSSDLFPAGFGWLIDFVSGQHKRLDKVCVEVDTFLDRIIDDHLKNKPEDSKTQDRPDIVDSILETMRKQEQDDSFKLTIDHLKGVIQDIFLGGVDTSAITMIWAMAELVKNPRVMKKTQEEIRKKIGIKRNERISEEEVDKIQYLKLVIKETLRLHPPGPLLLPRETMSEIQIQGYEIPKKTFVIVNVWSIGRDPKHWKDPEEFIPERFLDSSVDYRGQSFEMLPFGSGRRMCPGITSAIASVELGLLNLLYFFDWRVPGEEDLDMEEAGDVTIVKKLPLELLPILHH